MFCTRWRFAGRFLGHAPFLGPVLISHNQSCATVLPAKFVGRVAALAAVPAVHLNPAVATCSSAAHCGTLAPTAHDILFCSFVRTAGTSALEHEAVARQGRYLPTGSAEQWGFPTFSTPVCLVTTRVVGFRTSACTALAVSCVHKRCSSILVQM